MTIIRSSQNPVFKELKLLGKKGSYADSFLAEGGRLIDTVLRSGLSARLLVLSESYIQKNEEPLTNILDRLGDDVAHICLGDDLFKQLSATVSPQGILVVFQRPLSADFSVIGQADSVLVLDRVQDPGNVGTLLRLAAGLGFSAVILLKGCADPYEAKTLRSAMGATFQIPVVIQALWSETVAWLQKHKFRIYAADMNGTDLGECRFAGSTALVLGNEGNGLSREVRNDADEIVSISLLNGVESLNVAVAGAIIAYEIKRLVK